MKKLPANVIERWLLYDTVAAFNTDMLTTYQLPEGWFETLADMGGANKHDFFNVRSRSIGESYNNQDSRDQFPYSFQIHSIGISFFCHTVTQFPQITPDQIDNLLHPEDNANHIFTNDLPKHASMKLKIMQDDRLKLSVPMVPCGYGPYGGGFSRGEISTANGSSFQSQDDVAVDHQATVQSMGLPELDNRWPFPVPLEVPRTGNLNVVIEFNEYGRTILQNLPDLKEYYVAKVESFGVKGFRPFFGIQVSIMGERAIQQRAQYHV